MTGLEWALLSILVLVLGAIVFVIAAVRSAGVADRVLDYELDRPACDVIPFPERQR